MRAIKHQTVNSVFYLYFIGLLFILAPAGNLGLTLISSGIPEWYNPARLVLWSRYLSTADRICFGLIFFAGVNLLRVRKFSWLLAMATLIIVVFLNLYQCISLYGVRGLSSSLFLISIFSTISFFIILYFFRYPYIDKREGWADFHERIATQIPVKLALLNHPKAESLGEIVNISTSGARIILTPGQDQSFVKKGKTITIESIGEKEDRSKSTTVLTGKVIRVDEKGCAISFSRLNRDKQELIRRFMGSTG